MEFQTLKKSYKKQIIAGALAICIMGGALTFATTRARYKLTDDIELAKGTINYKPYDFKVMAMYKSEDGTNYTEINEMPEGGYVVNEEKTYCTTDNKTEVKGKIKTIDGNIAILNLNKNDKCYVWFDKKLPTASETILANITVNEGTPTTFASGATTDEGVYSAEDGMYGGTSYYWRGAVTNNYVKFANFCWRIVRINGDGSIRLIYDGATCHANGTRTTDSLAQPTSGTTGYAYNSSSNQSNYVGWTYEGQLQRPTDNMIATSSNAKIQLENWYSSNIIGTNANKVADGKYCNDRNVRSGDTWTINGSVFSYAAVKRISTDKTPTLSCSSGDVYTLSVGLITADEVMYAGGLNTTNNNSYYLYNGQNYWTMSPCGWQTYGDSYHFYAYVFYVNDGGAVYGIRVPIVTYGLRPVINLKADTAFQSEGNGTLDNPYVVS